MDYSNSFIKTVWNIGLNFCKWTAFHFQLELNKKYVYKCTFVHCCRKFRPTSDLAVDFRHALTKPEKYFDWSVSTSAFQSCVSADGATKSFIVEIKLQNCDKPQLPTLANIPWLRLWLRAFIKLIYKTEKLRFVNFKAIMKGVAKHKVR